MNDICPECGATHPSGSNCRDDFHQMLYWENEDPARGVVHHLMVLCYHLQHPSLYSVEGLAVGRQLLTDFVEHSLEPQDVRRHRRGRVDSGRRSWPITARPGNQGVYDRPISWTMTAADIVAGGADRYIANVRAWAETLQHDIEMTFVDR